MNCTFANNISVTGGGLHIRDGGTTIVTNSIFWENYPDQISLFTSIDTMGSQLYMNYSDLQFGVDSIKINDTVSVVHWGIGNIDEDPLFADTLNNDFHIPNSSPCITAGIDSIGIAGFWYYAPLTDIEGNPRPNPAGTLPDMGAYESEYPVKVNDDNSNIPTEYFLYQNYPNPFNPSTKIRFTIPELRFTILKIYDVLGNEIAILDNEEKPAGEYEVVFTINNLQLTSGVYFYQLRTASFVQTKKMLLIK